MMNLMAIVADYSFIVGIMVMTPVALFAMGIVDELNEKLHNSSSDRKVVSRWTTE